MKFLNSLNWPIFVASLLLVSVGILAIYSSSKEVAASQFVFILIGFVFFILLSMLDLHSVRVFVKPIYVFIIFLLVIVLILGYETRGSIRWIPLGFINIQPSEFAKPALILMIASFWAKNMPTWTNILKCLVIVSPVVLLVFKQPDLGSTLSLMAIWIGMLFASRISFRKALLLLLVAFFVIPLSWHFLQDYQKQRITGFLQPEVDPLGQGYNLIQSTIAVGSGQIWGQGLGRGTQSRLQFLPEHRTDFIFASIAEELGFFGSVLILSIYLFLLMYLLKIANQVSDKFSYLLTIGVFSMLIFQTIVNIGMNAGIMPITGITLPLISYGGSSMITTLACLGLISSVTKKKITFD